MPGLRRHLTLDVLRDHIAQHCLAPSDRGLVGVEIELLTYPSADPTLRSRAADLQVVAGEADLPSASRITLEPGGQVEISTPPLRGLDQALPAAAADLAAVSQALRGAGLEPVARGLDPLRPPERILDQPRYAAMEAFFDVEGFAGRTMMCSTAAVQVNLETGSSFDAVRERWHLAHAFGPLLVAMFAHSPVPGGGGCGPRSARQQVWSVMDPSRTGPVRGPILGGGAVPPGRSPSEEWLAYALAARVMMVRVTPERFIGVDRPLGSAPLTFGAWMHRGHELGWPTLDDFDYHLTTLFPPVRPRGWLELRMIDTLPDPWWRVAAAVATALLDDADAGAAALEAVSAPPGGTGVADHWRSAARHGLADPALRAAAARVFPVALEALGRLGADPVTVAAAEAFHERFVARGRCPADEPVPIPEIVRAAVGLPGGVSQDW
ncbi:MAG: ergothioneine biosynthesis glutamate--cysteine ligase EgtA [Actinobacteria bacterium]|nr:ergothioneine biosynthesis glutamate--cysteine ligase EgtA [Actinomycetota bacterium]